MSENISLPVLVVVDEEHSTLGTLVSDLERRFAADYRVVGSLATATPRLWPGELTA